MLSAMELTKWEHVRITAEDGIIDILDGMVIIDMSQASVYEWNPNRGRFDQVDRFTGCDVKTAKDKVMITGSSEHLVEEVRVPPSEARITLTIDPKAGCKDCG